MILGVCGKPQTPTFTRPIESKREYRKERERERKRETHSPHWKNTG